MSKKVVHIRSDEEKELINSLEKRNDPDAERLRRFLGMPDLSRAEDSPIYELVQRIVALPRFKDFDIVRVPEIVPVDVSFDLFNFPPDHPARKKSDTYFVDDDNVLRTHTTVMWYYWLGLQGTKEKVRKGESIGALSYGKVYRKDEIDRFHMPVFHQIDGWYLCPRSKKVIGLDDLKKVLIEIAQSVFGKGVQYRFNVDSFPYTDPSVEMEIERSGKWVEILGCGVVRGVVLKNLGVDPDVYNGWAFGFGVERLAIASMELPDIRLLWSKDKRVKRQLKLGRKYEEVSKYPPITRDISFVVNKDFVPNNYFELIRDLAGNFVEEVVLLDKYIDAKKFGENRISYTYRIVYRSNERTLTTDEVDPIQDKIYKETKEQFNAQLR